MIKRKISRFIPSQRIKGSDKELFIINYEGSTFEIQRTSNIYEPIIIRLNGELLDTIPSKQNKEIEFSTPAGKHKIQVWNERVENNLIPKIFVKDGIAAVIDGIPVQNTLADPVTRFKTGKVFIWLLTALLFLKAFIIPLTSQQLSLEGESRVFLFANIILFVLSLSAALTFQLNPLRSVWIALVVSLVEFASYILAVIAIKEIDFVVILFTILRLAILASLIFSLRNLKLILNFSDDEYQVAAEKPPIQKKVKRFSFPKKYIAISLISLATLVGGYFGISKIIESLNEPSLERDSSLEFRTDLNLPELIPYRKGDKWGYCDKNKKIILNPIYKEVVNFISDTPYKFIVNQNGLEGVIDINGDKIIPFIYDGIVYHKENKSFEVRKGDWIIGIVGLLNDSNKVIIRFEYKELHFRDNKIIADDGQANTIYDYNGNLLEARSVYYSKERFRIVENQDYYTGQYGLLLPTKGVIDQRGKFIISPLYTIIFRENKFFKAFSYFNEKWCLFDTLGQIILPPIYDYISSLHSDNHWLVNQNENFGLVDNKNQIIIPIIYDEVTEIKSDSEVYFLVRKDGRCGYINSLGEIIIPLDYDRLYTNENGLIAAQKNGKAGIVDIGNKIVVPFQYNYVSLYFDKLIGVGVIDNDEKEKLINSENIIDSKFIEWLLTVSNIKKYEFSKEKLNTYLNNPMGRYKFYNEFKGDLYFQDSVAFAITAVSGFNWESKLSKYGFVDYKNEKIIDFIYESIQYSIGENLMIVKLNGKWGVINEANKTVISFKYDEINNVGDYDLCEIKLNGKLGYVDLNGVEYFDN